MARGFICEAADVAGITTPAGLAFVITLGANTSRDAKATTLPSSAYWSHLDLVLLATAGTPVTLTARVTWDAAGDDPAVILTSPITLAPALTTANTFMGSISLGLWPTNPTGQATAGTLYLFIAVNAGTVTLKKARLHWADHQGK